MDDLLQEFLTETEENLATVDNELVRFEREPQDAEVLGNIFRLVHTVKGSCGFIGLPRLEKLAHAAETLLGKVRDGEVEVCTDAVTATLDAIDRIRTITAALSETENEPDGDDDDLIARLDALSEGKAAPAPAPAASAEAQDEAGKAEAPEETNGAEAPTAAPVQQAQTQTIRVSVDLLEELMTSVSELVLTRNQLLQERRRDNAEGLSLPLDRLSTQIGRLQESVMRTRMQPISGAWNILPRMVRSLAVDLGKKIDLEMEGGDTELDRQMLELIKDPLSHMVRNAADHGIETPEERQKTGKPETGRIRLAAAQEGGHITITLADDGRGLNTDRLREKAVTNGLMSRAEADAALDTQLSRLIFAAGFSTATEVTNVSGRGVGMDVVRANVEKIGGTIEVNSAFGKGTTFKVRIPLTLAIMPALIVGVGEARFAVPQIAVAELVRAGEDSEHKVERVAGAPVLRLRGRLLPLVHLGRSLGTQDTESGDHVLVIRSAGLMYGLVVDSIFDTEELVVKPVSRPLADLDIYSGNAILGDGSVIMILDANGLAAEVVDVTTEEVAEEKDAPVEHANRDAMLVFTAGGTPQPRAVPLSLVARIEDIEPGKIEQSGGEHVVQLRERLVPLVTTNGKYTPPAEGRQAALVFADRRDVIALAVDDIIDIVEASVAIEISSNDPARLGTAVIAGKATELIDVAYLLREHTVQRASFEYDRPAEEQARILVVDDSPFFRNMLKPLLDAAGYRVTVAEDVDEALAYRDKGETFDLILSDIEMPGKTGLDFARTVRSGGSWAKIPLVALSSLADDSDVDVGMAAGFDRYVAKFDRQRLLSLLATSLKENAA